MGVLEALVIPLSFFLITVPVYGRSTIPGTNNTDCSCGYYDASTKEVFTESIIVYFNETDVLPTGAFVAESYENKYEKGWNTQYRQGASLENVQIGNSTLNASLPQSLELSCDPTTADHLVVGGGIKSVREDIFFGSFRTMVRATQPWSGGSALSIMLNYNITECLEMDQINPNDPTDAWISMISHGQFPDPSLGVTFANLTKSSLSPWDFIEMRVDWSRNAIKYYVGGKLFRSVSRSEDGQLPQTPAVLFLKHWSIGNYFSTQGPPVARSVANIGWTRAFFNSSSTTDEEHAKFDARCQPSDACAMDDMTLRGYSPYSSDALAPWVQDVPPSNSKFIPLAIAVLSISATFFVMLHAFLSRIPWHKFCRLPRRKRQHQHSSPYAPSVRLTAEESRIQSAAASGIFDIDGSRASTAWVTPINRTRPSSQDNFVFNFNTTLPNPSATTLPYPSVTLPYPSATTLANPSATTLPGGRPTFGITIEDPSFRPRSSNRLSKDPPGAKARQIARHSARNSYATIASVVRTPSTELDAQFGDVDAILPSQLVQTFAQYSSSEKAKLNSNVSINPGLPTIEPAAPKPVAKKRVDYLAGLIALASLLVTVIHFCLTFANAAVNPDAYIHYQSEVWARKTITSYLINLNWIGPFLMTSTRFLVSTYLRTGNLRGVAEKTVQRPFRLLIPITCIAMLEYFFMDSGAITWLEYLASITWSTWPFTSVPENFGTFVSEILELAYLIPNAAPQITFNYCTGVLWTIPVQLQGTWVTLLGVIMIREIKTPWKRFGFYACCIFFHWYALSWGTYFYLGVLLTDLDVTFKWKEWLYAHAAAYYPLAIACALFAFGGLTVDLIPQWTAVNYVSYEYGLHPDTNSGLPIAQTANAGYPQYFVPKLNGLVFSVFFQALIELSPLVQKFFSFKVFVLIFPHIFTIYLIHGFIFWSLGSMICVFLSAHGLPYWANISIVAACCYSAIALSLPILTPVVETLGKNVTGNIWQFASEEPAPRRPTTYPFSPSILDGKASGVETEKTKDIDNGE